MSNIIQPAEGGVFASRLHISGSLANRLTINSEIKGLNFIFRFISIEKNL